MQATDTIIEITCSECNGHVAQSASESTCPVCNGRGKITIVVSP